MQFRDRNHCHSSLTPPACSFSAPAITKIIRALSVLVCVTELESKVDNVYVEKLVSSMLHSRSNVLTMTTMTTLRPTSDVHCRLILPRTRRDKTYWTVYTG